MLPALRYVHFLLFSTMKLILGHSFFPFILRFKIGIFDCWSSSTSQCFPIHEKRWKLGIFACQPKVYFQISPNSLKSQKIWIFEFRFFHSIFYQMCRGVTGSLLFLILSLQLAKKMISLCATLPLFSALYDNFFVFNWSFIFSHQNFFIRTFFIRIFIRRNFLGISFSLTAYLHSFKNI